MPSGQYRVVRKQTELNAPGLGVAAAVAIQHTPTEGVRRFVTAFSVACSSQAALAAVAELLVNLIEGPVATGTVRERIRIELAAAVVAPYDRTYSDVNIEVAADADLSLAQNAAIAGLAVDLALTVEDRIYD